MAKKWMWEVSSEVRANFAAWFEHNFLDQGAGRIGVRTYARAGEMDDVCAGRMPGDRAVWYHDAYERGLLDRTESLRLDECAFLLRNPLVGLQLALGITDLRGLRCYRRGLAFEINRLQQRAYRTRYYARDNAPPASRGGAAGDPPPHDTRALPDSRGVPRGVGGAQCVRRGARPFRGACPRPRVPCRQLPAHC